MALEQDRKRKTSLVRHLIETCLLLGGSALLAHSAFAWYKYASFQHTPFTNTHPLPDSKHNFSRNIDIREPQIIGQLEIERLGLSVMVVEGDDERSLDVGVGHMPGTASLGSRGNSVLAGHRDTAFWPLRNARVGDVIGITSGKNYRYRIIRICIVSSEDVSSLENSDTAQLTLISCYPFRHVGPAPRRIVLTAELIEG